MQHVTAAFSTQSDLYVLARPPLSPRLTRMASGSGQQYVRGLRADGLSEDEIYNTMKIMGYKHGRISQLLAATRASGSRDPGPDVAAEAQSQFEKTNSWQYIGHVIAGPFVLLRNKTYSRAQVCPCQAEEAEESEEEGLPEELDDDSLGAEALLELEQEAGKAQETRQTIVEAHGNPQLTNTAYIDI